MVVVLLTSLLLASCTEGGAPLEVADAYVRQPPPGMKMTAAFATLSNPGSDAVVLTGASSEGFSSVSIHETALVDGVARMRPVPQLEVGPGETVVLEPGGLHLMLMGAQGPVSADQTVSVTLQLGDGEQMIIEMPVRAPR
ncbi:MAG: copper chaperone PCu(A)C [Pseudomonadota bacterium]